MNFKIFTRVKFPAEYFVCVGDGQFTPLKTYKCIAGKFEWHLRRNEVSDLE